MAPAAEPADRARISRKRIANGWSRSSISSTSGGAVSLAELTDTLGISSRHGAPRPRRTGRPAPDRSGPTAVHARSSRAPSCPSPCGTPGSRTPSARSPSMWPGCLPAGVRGRAQRRYDHRRRWPAELAHRRDLTIVTNSLTIANCSPSRPNWGRHDRRVPAAAVPRAGRRPGREHVQCRQRRHGHPRRRRHQRDRRRDHPRRDRGPHQPRDGHAGPAAWSWPTAPRSAG